MTREDSVQITASQLVNLASADESIWDTVLGATFTHPNRGAGIVQNWDAALNRVHVRFPDGLPGVFSLDVFRDEKIITDLRLPTLSEDAQLRLERATQKLAAVEASRREHAERLRRYRLRGDPDDIGVLFGILHKLDSGSPIYADEEDWLKAERRYDVLAVIEEQKALRAGRCIHLARASAYWRKDGDPARAVEVTDDAVKRSDVPTEIWTSRGGAFRDLGQLRDAAECGRRALDRGPETYHPHNLLGAVLLEQGDLAAGEAHFARALQLGSRPLDQERSLRHIQKRSRAVANRIALHLLDTDSELYGWAVKFLVPPDNTPCEE